MKLLSPKLLPHSLRGSLQLIWEVKIEFAYLSLWLAQKHLHFCKWFLPYSVIIYSPLKSPETFSLAGVWAADTKLLYTLAVSLSLAG